MNYTPQTITGGANHSGVTRFAGFSIREAAGTPAAATVNFRSATVGGQILATVELAANESAMVFFPGPIVASGGVYVEQAAGTISGVLYNGR